jgi:hypothetical protein
MPMVLELEDVGAWMRSTPDEAAFGSAIEPEYPTDALHSIWSVAAARFKPRHTFPRSFATF